MTKRDTIYNALAEANQCGDYPTSRDIADGLGLGINVVSEALYRLADSGKIRRLPKMGARIRWEVVTEQTDMTKTYASPSDIVKAAVIQANLNGSSPTARALANTLSFTQYKVLSALYTLERRGEVVRVRDGRPYIRWKAVDTE